MSAKELRKLKESIFSFSKLPEQKNSKTILLERMGINEIDWEGEFSDVDKKCIPAEELVDYLNRVRANAPLSTAKREQFKQKYPFIHAKSKLFGDFGKELSKEDLIVDVDEFVNRMTQPPNFVVGTNEKMLKSGNENEFVHKTGIPAFRGLVYDKENDKFYFVNTCPGAGQCALICYALKGNFIRYSGSYDNMTKVLNQMLNEPKEYEEQLYNELLATAKKYNAFGDNPNKIIVRWNDSGDFFAKKYVEIASRVMDRLRGEGYHVQDYVYTKVADVANDEELFDSVKFSSGANVRQSKQVKSGQKSIVVPKELFSDLDLKDPDDLNTLKDRIVVDDKIQSESNIPIKRNEILTYLELMQKPVGEQPKWSVIITPNDGDDAGIRNDVQNVLLTIH